METKTVKQQIIPLNAQKRGVGSYGYLIPHGFDHRVVLWITRLVTQELGRQLRMEHLTRLCWDFSIPRGRVNQVLQDLIFTGKLVVKQGKTLADGSVEEFVEFGTEKQAG